jgi:coenzyme A diphosphatase NUDT7
VVVLLTHPDPQSILSQLSPNEGEVDHIFHHPLEALLDPDPNLIPVLDVEREKFSVIGGEDWPYETEWYVSTFRQLA